MYRTSIFVDRAIINEAQGLGLNVSAICRKAIAQAVHERNVDAVKERLWGAAPVEVSAKSKSEFGRSALPSSYYRSSRRVS